MPRESVHSEELARGPTKGERGASKVMMRVRVSSKRKQYTLNTYRSQQYSAGVGDLELPLPSTRIGSESRPFERQDKEKPPEDMKSTRR